MSEKHLMVSDLQTHFPIKGTGFLKKNKQYVKAVDGVSFYVKQGETLGIVGESGCGKSTLGRSILQLINPTAGSVVFKDQELTKLNKKDLREIRKDMQIVFQDPFSSLNPKMSVKSILSEALLTHDLVENKKDLTKTIQNLLSSVGLSPTHINRYPHQFSGGQRQRIGIARAIAVKPSLIIADEPVSALDVSVQAQILNLFEDLKEELNLTYIFIAHDLSVVKHVSDRIGVMYLGQVVELATKHDLYDNPLHPYTQALMSAVPSIDPDVKKTRIVLEGDVPSAASPPSGCPFHTRCIYKQDICTQVIPKNTVLENNRQIRCHMYDEEFKNKF